LRQVEDLSPATLKSLSGLWCDYFAHFLDESETLETAQAVCGICHFEEPFRPLTLPLSLPKTASVNNCTQTMITMIAVAI
jgi:hypothetical protein